MPWPLPDLTPDEYTALRNAALVRRLPRHLSDDGVAVQQCAVSRRYFMWNAKLGWVAGAPGLENASIMSEASWVAMFPRQAETILPPD